MIGREMKRNIDLAEWEKNEPGLQVDKDFWKHKKRWEKQKQIKRKNVNGFAWSEKKWRCVEYMKWREEEKGWWEDEEE